MILESDRALAIELTRADCAMWPKSREFFIEEAAKKIAEYREKCGAANFVVDRDDVLDLIHKEIE